MTGPTRLGRSIRYHSPVVVRRLHPAGVLVGAAIIAYVLRFWSLTYDIHQGLGTSSYDYGLYDQGIWLVSRFREPFITLMGRNLFGDHTSFIVIFLVPFYWIAPGALTLLGSQSIIIAAGAVPIYGALKSRLGNWGAALLAVAYLVHPAVGWTNLENFHPDAALGFTIGLALWGALDRRWRLYLVGVVLSLLVKEDVSLVIVPIGIWVAWRRDRRIGLATVVGSIIYMAIAMFGVMRLLIGVPTRNGWRIPFGGPWGVLSTLVTSPGEVISYLVSDGRPWYLFQMMVPVAFIFVRRPWVAMASAVVLFTNILSQFWYQYHIEYHYSLIAVPALVIGAGYAIAQLSTTARRRIALGAVAVSAGIASVLWSPVPWGRRSVPHWSGDHPVAVAAREIVAEVPDGVAVSAHYAATAHLAHRPEIYQFPNPFRIVLYGTDIADENGRVIERAERVEYLVLPIDRPIELEVDFQEIDAAFVKVSANDYWELWQRDRSIPLPPRGGE
ncbi:MAG: hypothetical protein CSA55_01480 [Ilumatobacter coccineus]|uniref:DUF2079 domain-containing protein n=1 Tax=Ilumatobacter coccineus TaxID=467094 RepID=A0A2G6KE59_9ACTN|nr:MAG: hypothetical protein CSA55_01480 [Ilumatobacter coccineus]